MEWKKIALVAGGFLLGTCGLKILGSEDAKKVYTNTTAAAFRVKDQVLKDVAEIRENAEDIAAAAREKNEQRQADADAQIIEDAAQSAAEAAGAEA